MATRISLRISRTRRPRELFGLSGIFNNTLTSPVSKHTLFIAHCFHEIYECTANAHMFLKRSLEDSVIHGCNIANEENTAWYTVLHL